MRKILLHSIIALSWIISSCHGDKSAVDASKENPYQLITISKEEMHRMDIKTGIIAKGSVNHIIGGTGKMCVAPNSEAIVSSSISGKISKIFVLEGQYIKKGQPLFSFNSFELIELQQTYLTSKNDAHFYVHEYERQNELRQKNIGSLAEFQSIESKYFNALNNKESLGEKLILIGIDTSRLVEGKENIITSTIHIPSPIDGYLIKLDVKLGQRIEPNAELAKVIDLSSMYAEVNVYEKDIDLIHEKQEVFIDFVNESMPHQWGYIDNISRFIDPDSRSIKIYVKLKDLSNTRILPGMAIKTEIKSIRTENDKKFIAPLTGILQEGELYYIFLLNKENNTQYEFKKTKVFLGESDGNHTELNISESLPDSINIVTKNVYLLNNEMSKR